MTSIFAIIVTYNGAEWLSKCITSLQNSSIKPKIIIIDNNSSDGTRDIIRSNFHDVKLFELEHNLGFGKANNIGIEYALTLGADYVFLLNQDAWVLPDTIEGLVKIQMRNPEYMVLSPLHLDGTGKRLDFNFSTYISPKVCPDLVSDLIVSKHLREVYQTNFVNAAFWLLSKECISTIGMFDPIFSHYGEDNDYLNRVVFHGYKIGICPHFYGFHDRSQEVVIFNNLPSAKRNNRTKMVYLSLLMNINQSLIKNILGIIKRLIRAILSNLSKKNLNGVLSECMVFLAVILKLNTISRRRNVNKQPVAKSLNGVHEPMC